MAEILADGTLIGVVEEFEAGETLDIEIVTIDRPSRPLRHGNRPLSDETLCDYIERVVMHLPDKQRPVLFHSISSGRFKV